MKDRSFILWWSVMAFLLLLWVLTFALSDKPETPEIEMAVTHTNVAATVITYVKTENGRKITWGFATVNNRTFTLLPVIE